MSNVAIRQQDTYLCRLNVNLGPGHPIQIPALGSMWYVVSQSALIPVILILGGYGSIVRLDRRYTYAPPPDGESEHTRSAIR